MGPVRFTGNWKHLFHPEAGNQRFFTAFTSTELAESTDSSGSVEVDTTMLLQQCQRYYFCEVDEGKMNITW